MRTQFPFNDAVQVLTRPQAALTALSNVPPRLDRSAPRRPNFWNSQFSVSSSQSLSDLRLTRTPISTSSRRPRQYPALALSIKLPLLPPLRTERSEPQNRFQTAQHPFPVPRRHARHSLDISTSASPRTCLGHWQDPRRPRSCENMCGCHAEGRMDFEQLNHRRI